MSAEPTTLLQGTLDPLILKSLAGEMPGLEISRRIQQITGGTFVVKPGSLFHRTGWKRKAGPRLFGVIRKTIAARNTTVGESGTKAT